MSTTFIRTDDYEFNDFQYEKKSLFDLISKVVQKLLFLFIFFKNYYLFCGLYVIICDEYDLLTISLLCLEYLMIVIVRGLLENTPNPKKGAMCSQTWRT